jgi:glyoxylase-like metal-dependent hydrolase (beta-lactamase superfamily II)
MRISRVAGSDVTDPRDCSVYLLDAGELVMIDAGFGERIDLMASHIEQQGLNAHDISTVILTHCHVDHIGGADEFRRRFGSRLVMHELDAAIVARGDNRLTAAFCFQKVFRSFHIDLILTGEEQRLTFGSQELVCLHTPGHTPGSISIYADVGEKRVLFAQDLGAPLLEEFDCDRAAWQSSAKKLLNLNADILCDGHTGVYQSRRMVRKYIESCMASNLDTRHNSSS